MVSHKHRCIFVHISKCAGTTVEQAFGVNPDTALEMGYGWNPEIGIHLQHATPGEMLKAGLFSREQWNGYYKFIVVRNPYARAYSDYAWVMLNGNVWGRFNDFLKGSAAFKARMTNRTVDYMGEHLRRQTEYFTLDGKEIVYDTVVRLEQANEGFAKVCSDLNLPADFFKKPANVNSKKLPHYSWFYTAGRKRAVERHYGADLEFLNYSFDDRRDSKINFKNDLRLMTGKQAKLNFRLKYPFAAHKWGKFKRKLQS